MPTTWSATDKTNVTVSGGNLIATGTGVGAVRGADFVYGGKYYWEVTIGTIVSGSTGAGLASISAALGTVANTPLLAVVLYKSGLLYVNSVSQGTMTAALVAGNVVCIAYDATQALIWFRIGAAGNWNNNAAFAPGGTGGVSVTPAGIGNIYASYPLFACGASADAATANFGATGFTGAVPSGYTSGFPSGTAAITRDVLTQAAVEQWARAPSPTMQLTQNAIEAWVTVNTVNPYMNLTQAAIEEWASVATIIPFTQARAMIIA
jgi:hypothetical protein